MTLKRKRNEYEAINEIRHEQRGVGPILDEQRFSRLVREVGQDFKTGLSFTPNALAALQAATEDFLIELFGDANLAAIHADRSIIQPKDMKLACNLRGLPL